MNHPATITTTNGRVCLLFKNSDKQEFWWANNTYVRAPLLICFCFLLYFVKRCMWWARSVILLSGCPLQIICYVMFSKPFLMPESLHTSTCKLHTSTWKLHVSAFNYVRIFKLAGICMQLPRKFRQTLKIKDNILHITYLPGTYLLAIIASARTQGTALWRDLFPGCLLWNRCCYICCISKQTIQQIIVAGDLSRKSRYPSTCGVLGLDM